MLYRLTLLDRMKSPIDPFTADYWSEMRPAVLGDTEETRKLKQLRLPLQDRSNLPQATLAGSFGMNPSSSSKAAESSKLSKNSSQLLTGETLVQFKRELVGSDLTQAGVLAILKKK